MPYSIDRQINDTRQQIQKYQKKLAALLKTKENRILKVSTQSKKRDVQKLIKGDVPFDEIIKLLE